MKAKLILCLIVVAMSSYSAITTRVVSASTIIAVTDDLGRVVNTGGNVTFTLSASILSGFSCTVYNHGTGNVTFSAPITVANGQTITVLPKSASGIEPGIMGNSINIFYDGTTWRGGK